MSSFLPHDSVCALARLSFPLKSGICFSSAKMSCHVGCSSRAGLALRALICSSWQLRGAATGGSPLLLLALLQTRSRPVQLSLQPVRGSKILLVRPFPDGSSMRRNVSAGGPASIDWNLQSYAG